jgi:hypothetical protein
MSRKLSALALALGILVCSMGLKTVLSSHAGSTVIIANGPAPAPGGTPPPPK